MKTRTYLAASFLSLAALNTRAQDPWIANTNYPMDTNASLGATVSFRVYASSTNPPLTYQWQHEGTNLPAATNFTLIISNLAVAHAGGYMAMISNAIGGFTNSRTAILNVDPTFIKITQGAIVTDVEPTQDSTWWDYDNDGDLDVVVHVTDPVSGSGLAQSFYRNDGSGVFTKITTNAVALTLKRGLMGAVGDYDNDGDPDLYLASNAWQANHPKDDLFRNEGNGRFTVVAAGPWQSDLDHSWDSSFVDINQDGLLDIFVVNWEQPPCLYRQTPASVFVKVAAAEVGSILANPGRSYNAAWADYDIDGDQDLWMGNYQGSSRLHRNEGNGFFVLATPPSFAQSPGGQGVWADFDNDGVPELFVGGDTETGARANALFRGTAGQDFQNVAATVGVALTMAIAAQAVGDYDNDGWLDIFTVHYYEGAANPAKTNVLFHNRRDGTFEAMDVGSPIRDGTDSRLGTRWVDYDNDGFLDLFMTCGSGGISRLNHLYRNNLAATGNSNHWLKVKLVGQASNRSGIGAKIRVKATIGGQEIRQVREMTGNGYSQTCPGLIAHFGLGNAKTATTFRVEWPSGTVEEFVNVPADQLITLVEPSVRGAMKANGEFELTLTGSTNRVCQVEYSSDLVNWTSLTNVTGQGETPVKVTDSDAPAHNQRFYRVK